MKMYFNKQCLNSNVTPQFANVKIKNKTLKCESLQINNIHLHTYLRFRYVCMYVYTYLMVISEQDRNM